MSLPPAAHGRHLPQPAAPGNRCRRARRPFAGKRRALMLASAASFLLALLTLALPANASADSNSLASYGATASGWAIQPYVVNDAFLNVPAADQSAPYVFITMDNTPGARAKASYLFPGTAVNAVPNTQGVPVTVPDGVEARYPGTGSNATNVGTFNDGVATQASAGSQAAQATEGYAQAQAALAGYQFAPTAFTAPGTGLPPVAIPTLPGAPSLTPTAPGLPPAGGASPTPTSGSGGPAATPTVTPVCIGPFCLAPTPASGQSVIDRAALAAYMPAVPATPVPVTLPDNVEQTLATALKAAQLSNPELLSLAGGKFAAPDPKLPYASADTASQATARATDSGVSVDVSTHATKVELLQGLITFASVESTLQANAPASGADGSGAVTTRIVGATIGGVPVSVDNKGVTVNDQNASTDQVHTLTDQLNAALRQANLHIEVIRTVSSAKTGFWEGSGAAVEVTAGVAPSATGLPNPISGVPGTRVDFTIAQVSANIFATPGQTSTDSSGDTGGGGFGFGFFSDNGFGASGDGTTTPQSHGGGGAFSVLGGLSGGALLALVFVVQGLSTAAAAATAGYTDLAAKASEGVVEEETQ